MGIPIAGTVAGTDPGGGAGSPGALAWTNINGHYVAYSNTQTFTGFTGSISIRLSESGAGQIRYDLNGATYGYSGPFAVKSGDMLSLGISVGTGLGAVAVATGNLTVTNATASTTLATIPYYVTNS